jgi:hypothetical protein
VVLLHCGLDRTVPVGPIRSAVLDGPYGTLLFGSIIISLVRLSLWLALVALPVVVRFDVARGTRGIVVRVNVARALCPFFD